MADARREYQNNVIASLMAEIYNANQFQFKRTKAYKREDFLGGSESSNKIKLTVENFERVFKAVFNQK